MQPDETITTWGDLAAVWLPVLAVIALWVWFMRRLHRERARRQIPPVPRKTLLLWLAIWAAAVLLFSLAQLAMRQP